MFLFACCTDLEKVLESARTTRMSQRATYLLAATATTATIAAIILLRRRRRRPSQAAGLIFTGTGCSSGLPLVGCALGAALRVDKCEACVVANRRGPSDKNWRQNVGALLRYEDPTGQLRFVQIDCGKTFRESVLKVYKDHGVTSLDALILTHDHADAICGLDELRSLQRFDPVTFDIDNNAIRCICDRRTMSRLRHMFPYLMPKPPSWTTAGGGGSSSTADDTAICKACALDLEMPLQTPESSVPPRDASPAAPPPPPPITHAAAANGGSSTDAAPAPIRRFIAKIDWRPFGKSGSPLGSVATVDVYGLTIHCLPVMHGSDYTCFGFAFGPKDGRTVYLSDYTKLLPQTEALLREWSGCEGGSGSRIELLVLDALRWSGAHPVHATVEESVALAQSLKPRRCLLVGMGHGLEHNATNRRLRSVCPDVDVQLAFDVFFVPLRIS